MLGPPGVHAHEQLNCAGSGLRVVMHRKNGVSLVPHVHIQCVMPGAMPQRLSDVEDLFRIVTAL